jgi:hypothetical protein
LHHYELLFLLYILEVIFFVLLLVFLVFFKIEKTHKNDKNKNTIENAHLSIIVELWIKHRKSKQGKHLNDLFKSLKYITKELLAHYEITFLLLILRTL